MTTDNDGTRLNKFISETGICSRREADRLIEQGRVLVNGQVAGMGLKVSDADQIKVNGKPLRAKPKAVYLVYNKPVGITCTTDQAIAGNIVDAVNYKARIFPIGRLDKPSCGLILLTNDGDIVNKILRAGNAHEKEYVVSVDRPVTDDFIRKMAAGVPILDTVTKPCKVKKIGQNSFNIILTQGLNRQIRRMAEYLGFNVTSLKRIRIMNISLGGLRAGQWREVSPEELAIINGMVQGSSKTEEASVLDVPRAARKTPSPRSRTGHGGGQGAGSSAARSASGAGRRQDRQPGRGGSQGAAGGGARTGGGAGRGQDKPPARSKGGARPPRGNAGKPRG